jgi:predicted O-linked N-acetylglucosamine transferase (SPINDLY family)
LLRRGRLAEAVADYDRALQVRPDFSQAWFNRGTALMKLNRIADAIPSLDRAARLKPDNRQALVLKAYLQAKICDWSAGALPPGADLDAEPFLMLGMDDDPARQLARAQNWARASFPTTPASLPGAGAPGGKLRLGYFSADVHDHPVMHLMARLFELHDRERFEVHLFSFGPERQDAMRQRAVNAVDRFHDVREMSDAAILALARDAGIDIAIDLMGYTRGSRTEIFARRAAPVQVNYLGYPGTLGAGFMDYIIADPWMVPDDDRRFYAETVVHMPHSFMATDNSRAAAEDRFSRAQFGLPEDGIVFCCFNNGYKITPAEFGIWMRLLQKVPGSVAWLTRDSEEAAANLIREAAARGIDKSRLVFATRMPDHGDYLARYRCADIFLDTFNYNAHATASDVLWAGLPLVTRSGRSFPSRVAGSLLKAVGLPELVTQTAEAYEALALDLATQPQRLAEIKARLAANRLTMPLFDSQGFTRDFERLLETMRAP